jgi:hypothetical protein
MHPAAPRYAQGTDRVVAQLGKRSDADRGDRLTAPAVRGRDASAPGTGSAGEGASCSLSAW